VGAPYFKVLNNVNLLNSDYAGNRVLNDFSGTIFTDKIETIAGVDVFYNYKISGVRLNNINKNLL
jgi:hypothetical protein